MRIKVGEKILFFLGGEGKFPLLFGRFAARNVAYGGVFFFLTGSYAFASEGALV